MRLNRAYRRAFVNRVMADVPKIDYVQIVQEEVAKKCKQLLPRDVHALLGTPLEDYVARFNVVAYVSVPGSEEDYEYSFRAHAVGKNEDEVCAVLKEVAAQYVAARKAQEDMLEELQNKLIVYVGAFNTFEQLEQMLPEFKQYIQVPAYAAPKQLPVASNLVTDFMRAGWPKGENR